jgi:Nif-specific regulatory protein
MFCKSRENRLRGLHTSGIVSLQMVTAAQGGMRGGIVDDRGGGADSRLKVPADDATFRLIHELSCAFASRIELEELIPFVIDRCREVLSAEGVSVLLLDPDRNQLYFPYISQSDPGVAARLARLRFPADRGVAGAVLKSGEPQRVDNVQSDPRFYSDIDRQTGVTTRSILAAPLISPEGPLGVIEAVDLGGRATFFNDQDLAMLKALTGSIASAISNARRFGSLKDSAQRLRFQVQVLRRDLARHDRFSEVIGTSPGMKEVFRLMEAGAGSPIPVLIEGETGTGKELVARAIHRTSARAESPFLAVNCAALPETLLESELFGHRRGAFTGAISEQPGLFPAANGGVIFLDEIGEMPFTMQAKLLRVLQEQEVVAIGDHRPQKIDVKVISATNRDLKAAVAKREFREDLYYRLAGLQIHLPPLRERREDIAMIAAHVLKVSAERHGKRIAGFAPAALETLSRMDWPGNVRELQNEVERAVMLALDGETIRPDHLSDGARADAGAGGAAGPASDAPAGAVANRPLREVRTAFEARYIGNVLAQHHGNVSHAAATLRISRTALQKKMKRYGLR